MSQTLFLGRARLARFLAGLLCAGMLMSFAITPVHALTPPNPDRAMTTTEMIALIQVLMKQVAQLQAILAARNAAGVEGGFISPGLNLGSTVQTTDVLKVRQTPSVTGQMVGYQSAGARGKVVSAAQAADGYTWYKIDYDYGADGWSALNWLREVSVPNVPTSPSTTLGCELTTDRSSYSYGDSITAKWTSVGAAYTAFVPDTSGKDSITVSSQKQGTSGSNVLSASVVGLPQLTLKAVAADGRTSLCTVTVKVVDKTTSSFSPAAYVDEVSAKADVVVKSSLSDTGVFQISFDVTADDDDVFIGDVVDKALTVRFHGLATPAAYSFTLTSTASEFNGYYVVEEGDTESFTVQAKVTPSISETYWMGIDSLVYRRGGVNGPTEKAQMDSSDQFETPRIWLGATAGTSCSSGGKTYPEGTKLTTVTNQYGTSLNIADAYYVCRSGIWKIEGGLPAPSTGVSFTTQVSGNTVTANFGLRTGCDGYRIDWGDGQEVTRKENFSGALVNEISGGPICTAINSPVSIAHTYANAGTYTIKLTPTTNSTNGVTTSKTVTVSGGSTTNTATAPQKNYFGCSNRGPITPGGTYADGKIACYGMWDYGNDFGGDADICEDSNHMPITGCKISVPVCASGLANATKYYSNSALSSNTSKLNEVAANLQTTTGVVKAGVAHLWEYSCTPATISSVAPQKNYFACNRTVAGKYADGKIACYGMWDYGNDFGGDVNMCGGYNGSTGCTIAAPVCASGSAVASSYYSNSALSSNSNALAEAASNLQVTTGVVKNGVAGLWVYSCSQNDSFGYSQGSVLGASTDTKSSLQTQIDAMRTILYGMLNNL